MQSVCLLLDDEMGISPIMIETRVWSCKTSWIIPRTARQAPGEMIFHVLNRGNARDAIFMDEADYRAFEKVLLETQEQVFVRILSYCLMPNHWHLVLWPLLDGHWTMAIWGVLCSG